MKNNIHLLENKFDNLFEKSLIEEIIAIGKIATFKEGDIIIDINQEISNVPIVLSGSIKILTEDENGNELLLYYLEYNETCAISLNFDSTASKSSIRAIAENDIQIILIPIEFVDKWMIKFPKWRKFIIESFQFRLKEMLKAIDVLAFNNMETRVLHYLKDKMLINNNKVLKLKHLDIASELNSSRVVISRIMKKLELDGYIIQGRNKVEIKEINNLVSTLSNKNNI